MAGSRSSADLVCHTCQRGCACLILVHKAVQNSCCVGWQQDECRGWDVNEIVFSPAMWPVYHALMRADFTLFDEYKHEHAGAQTVDCLPTLSLTLSRPSLNARIIALHGSAES